MPPSWCRARKPETHRPQASSFPTTELTVTSAQCRFVHMTANCWIKVAGPGPSNLDGYLLVVFEGKKVGTLLPC